MTALPDLDDIADEYEFLDSEDRYRLLIDLGRRLEPMPDALKTDAVAKAQELKDGFIEQMNNLKTEAVNAVSGLKDAIIAHFADKTDATKVRGCSSSTWVYPTRLADGRLHFLADSNAAITKGIVALVIAAVQDRQPAEIASLDIAGLLAPFDLTRELSSNRTQGVPNMIALVHDTALRLASA